MSLADHSESIWKWLAVTLGGVVIAGLSHTLTLRQADTRLSLMEKTIIRIEEQAKQLAERQARDRSDLLSQLERIERGLERLSNFHDRDRGIAR